MRHQRFTYVTVLGFLFLGLSFAAFSKPKNEQKPQPLAGASHARVVRLSFTEGTVTLRRPGSTEWTGAMVNTPIQEGFSVATGKKSFAEVQFENGSTARLGELSSIDFTELALSPQGGHVNHVTLDDGYATFHIEPQRNDEYLVSASDVTLTPQGKTEFRADLNQVRVRVEVFSGRVRAAGPTETQTLKKNHELVRDIGSTAAFQLADKVEKDDWDKWTDARDRQGALAYDEEAVTLDASFYGWDDLDIYGEWGYLPGYGNAWWPYEPVGWSPYSAGLWSWYPGMGYTWISGEPWGWLPFHYGYWNFNPDAGWFWMPGAYAGWSPAMVAWYSGPGWIGWTPIGPGGRSACALNAAGCLIAVPPTVLGNGEPIVPGSPHLMHPRPTEEIRAIAQPSVAPVRPATPSRPPVLQVANSPAGRVADQSAGSGTPAPQSVLPPSGFVRGRDSAPSSVIMGQAVTAQTFAKQYSALKSGDQPIRVHLGGAMGGQLPVASSLAGREPHGGPGAQSRPQILARSPGGSAFQGGGGSPGSARSVGGDAHVSSGVGGGSHGGGASFSGGHSGGGGGHR